MCFILKINHHFILFIWRPGFHFDSCSCKFDNSLAKYYIYFWIHSRFRVIINQDVVIYSDYYFNFPPAFANMTNISKGFELFQNKRMTSLFFHDWTLCQIVPKLWHWKIIRFHNIFNHFLLRPLKNTFYTPIRFNLLYRLYLIYKIALLS